MEHLNRHALKLMEKINFPSDAVNEFSRVMKRIDDEPRFAKDIDKEIHSYMFPKASKLDLHLEKLTNIAEKNNVNCYTLHMVFLILCAEELHNRYIINGISDEVFYDTMDDMRCKNKECMDCKGVWGTFVGNWYGGFFEMNRFALGRFQYETSIFEEKEGYISKCGYKINYKDTIYNFHIPSSGISLTDEVRLDSYKRAYEFFKPKLDNKPLVMCCGSWLLYQNHKKFLSPDSKILRFIDDFEIIRSEETDRFKNDWRVFAADADKPYEELPENTSLQRAYKHWLLNGNKAGDGYGIIIFDGEKILR